MRRVFFGLIAGLAVGAAGLIGWERHAATGLREEIAWQQIRARELASLQAEHHRLVAAQVSIEDLDRLRAERAAVADLRTQLDAIKHRSLASQHAGSGPALTPSDGRAAEPAISLGPVDAAHWRNAGNATPAAAFESVLWSAAGGEVESLAGLLLLDDATRARAGMIFARLPVALQSELGTPEQLVALLTAKDVPLGSAQITASFPLPSETRLVAALTASDGTKKTAVFSLQKHDDRWGLLVPEAVVEKYATQLAVPPGAPGGE